MTAPRPRHRPWVPAPRRLSCLASSPYRPESRSVVPLFSATGEASGVATTARVPLSGFFDSADAATGTRSGTGAADADGRSLGPTRSTDGGMPVSGRRSGPPAWQQPDREQGRDRQRGERTSPPRPVRDAEIAPACGGMQDLDFDHWLDNRSWKVLDLRSMHQRPAPPFGLDEERHDRGHHHLVVESGRARISNELRPAVVARRPIQEVSPLQLPEQTDRNAASHRDLFQGQARRSSRATDVRDGQVG